MKNNQMKGATRMTSMILAATMCLGLAACGSSTQTTQEAGTVEETSSAQETATTEASSGGVTVIKAGTSGSPRPFVYVDDDNNLTGHNIELIEAVFERLPQYELEIEKTEFSSIFTGIDAGYYRLGVNNLAKNAEREAKYLYTDPEMVNHYIVLANKNIDIDEIQDLTELAGTHYIGGPGNDKTTLIENYNEEHPDAQIIIDYADSDLLLQIQAVEDGSEDFLIIDEPMYKGYYEPEFHPDVNTYSLENVASAAYSYFIVGKDDTQLAEDINAALKEVIADGTAREICLKYFGEDYSPEVE